MFRTDHLLSLRRLIFVNNITLKIHDLQDGDRRDFFAAVCEDGEGGGHIDQADVPTAQR